MAISRRHPRTNSFPSSGLGTEHPCDPVWQIGNNARANRGQRRSGVILAAVLIGLLIVMLVGAELTRTIMLHHRQTRLAESRQQSFWLAESAVQRAAHALANSPEDYEGETWHIPAEELGAGNPGVAIIHVESAADPETGRVIRVQAYYPEDGVHRILHERKLSVNLSSPGGSP